MKRLILCTLALAAGVAIGATIRFSQYWQHGFRQGYASAISQFQCEAVREGHGHWERANDSVSFSWNETRNAYRPDSTSQIPGLD